jgi:hypothetical protein
MPKAADVNKLIAAPILTCGLLAALIPLAGNASAFCDSPDCVPNVARNVIGGGPCVPGRLFVYGLDSDNRTFVCNTAGMWAPAGPLVGLRQVALPCDAPLNSSAQGADGVPLVCADMNNSLRWAHRVDTPG